MTEKEQFFKIIIRADQRISPKTINKEYFQKIDKLYLWDFFLKETDIFKNYSIKDRLFFWSSNIENLKYCRCSKECIVSEKRYSNYCSAKCARTDSDSKKKSALKRNNIEANIKRSNTMLEKYGVSYNSQRIEVKDILSKPKVADDVYILLNDKNWLENQYITQNHTSVTIAESLGIYYGTVITYLKKFNIEIKEYRNKSTEENEIKLFIESLGFNVEQSNRKILDGYEIDLYIPEKNLAIEINGLYWHSYNCLESIKEKSKHRNKSLLAKSKNIFLFHFTDYEWNNKKDLVKSMICNKLGLSTKIFARNCTINYINNKLYNQFCTDNHISGYARASKRIGLFYNKKLISILSFNKSRYDKETEYEIIRFCSLKNYHIVGGFSKMLSKFVKDNNPKSIGTYSDNSFGTGNVYLKNGFNHYKSIASGYFWTDTRSIIKRYLTQKKRIKNLLGDLYNPSESESENMFRNKYRRFWDAGHEYFKKDF